MISLQYSTVFAVLLVLFTAVSDVNGQFCPTGNREQLPSKLLSAPVFRITVPETTLGRDSCEVAVCVDASGRVTDAAIVVSSGSRELDTTALRASFGVQYEAISGSDTARHFGDVHRWRSEYNSQIKTSDSVRAYTLLQIDSIFPFVAYSVELEVIDKLRTGQKSAQDIVVDLDFSPEIEKNDPIPLPDIYNNTITTIVRAKIDRNGKAIEAQIKKSSLLEYKDSLAVRRVFSCSYLPGMHGGYPVNCALDVEVSFTRANKKEEKAPAIVEDSASLAGFPAEDEYIPVEQAAEMVQTYPPRYPISLLEKGISGTVWVKALIDSTGAVRMAKIMKSAGNDELDASALEAAWKCEFKPGIMNSRPVAMWISFKTQFRIDK